MRKFLKTLALVIAIIALLVLIVGGLDMWLNNGVLLGKVVQLAGVSWITPWSILLLAGGALLVAIIMSPKGVDKAVGRVVEGAGHVVGGTVKAGINASKSIIHGVSEALGLGKWGPWLLCAAGVGVVWWLLPDKDDRNQIRQLEHEERLARLAAQNNGIASNVEDLDIAESKLQRREEDVSNASYQVTKDLQRQEVIDKNFDLPVVTKPRSSRSKRIARYARSGRALLA